MSFIERFFPRSFNESSTVYIYVPWCLLCRSVSEVAVGDEELEHSSGREKWTLCIHGEREREERGRGR